MAVVLVLGQAGCSQATIGPNSVATNSVAEEISAAAMSEIVIVDPQTVYVEAFEGWGTALAWGGVVVGGWPDEKRTDIADKLFSLEVGLGLNVVRYNIGGGPNPPDKNCGRMRPGGDVPGYLPVEGQWDWSADANQRWFLQAAKERGANLFLAFSDSPPAWMTISGCTNGAADGGNNLSPENYPKFADYLVTVIEHFRDEWGIQFHALAPLNEPNSDWWRQSGRQEGTAFDRPAQVAMINTLAEAMAARGLSDVLLAVADTNTVDEMVGNWSYYPPETQAHIGLLTTHTYGTSPLAAENLRRIARQQGKKLWMTEFGAGPGPYDLHSMLPALDLALRIVHDMKYLSPSAWIVWDGLESDEENQPNNILWGLITARYLGNTYEYHLTRQYYAMGNFSKFVRPGAQIIGTRDSRTLAAYSKADGQLILVTFNTFPEDRQTTYDLRAFRPIATATPYRTSAEEDLERLPDIQLQDNQLTVAVKARSVTTFVMTVR
jgi:O-glycosyl hydrolase